MTGDGSPRHAHHDRIVLVGSLELSSEAKNPGDDDFFRKVYHGEQSHSPIDILSIQPDSKLGRAHLTCGYFDAGIPAMREGSF